jgi:hypothetical protein
MNKAASPRSRRITFTAVKAEHSSAWVEGSGHRQGLVLPAARLLAGS